MQDHEFMNSIVLYYYPNKPVRPNTLQDSALWVGDDIAGFVRTELHMNQDAEQARSDAKPLDNETVLGAVEL